MNVEHSKDTMLPRLICVGTFAGAHGVHGHVKIKSFCASPEALATYQPLVDETNERQFKFRIVRRLASHLVAEVEGLDTREQAQNLRGLRLFAHRARFPKVEDDEFYHADLVGLTIIDTTGQTIGKIRAVSNFGAGDFLEIENHKKGNSDPIPFTRARVPIVDIARGRVVVELTQAEG